MTASVRRLNHAVLYVRDARTSAAFYEEAFGFRTVATVGEGAAVFMRAAETDNHHDLGLFTIGAERVRSRARPRRPVPPRVGGRHDPGPRHRCATGS